MSSVKYTPGNEPQELKLKLQRFFEKVDAAYPAKVLCNFYRDHKKWGETLTKLRRELGYDDNTSFWEAYGYTVVVQGVTAPKTADDYQVVIEELKKRYEGRTCPTMNRFSIENPDLSGKIKTLQNKAPTVFGMTLKEKLVAEGVLAKTPRAQSSIEVPKKTPEERFEETIKTLKDRYVNSEEKPSSLAELKLVNRDLSLGPQFFSYIKNKYGKKSEEYFVEIGVISNKKQEEKLNKKCNNTKQKSTTNKLSDDELFAKYYVTPELKDFNGKGILLDIRYETDRAKVRAVLKKYNVSVKRVMSNKVDCVITDDMYAYNKRRKHSSIVEECLADTEKTGVSKLVYLNTILDANDKLVEQQFVSMSKEEKLNYALSLYNACINKVQTMMDNVGTYGDPICSGISDIRAKIHPNVEISDADDFLNKVAKFNKSWGGSYKDTAKSYRKLYKEIFDTFGCDLDECVGIEVAIALSVACFVYGTPDCEIHIEWVRDKWESRGDYSASFNVGFELSSAFAEGRVVRCSKEAYDM